MSLSDVFENKVLLLYFNATAWANVADNAASSPLTNIEVSAHTADPGDAGSQTTSETAYTSYARVAVARNAGGWTVTNNSCSPAAQISFPACTGSTSTLTHMGAGTAHTSTGVLHMSGAITPNISVATGVTPILTTATAVTLD
jgi:hypothetical protein